MNNNSPLPVRSENQPNFFNRRLDVIDGINVNSRGSLAKRCADAGGDCDHDARTMIGTQLKKLAAAGEKLAHPERTVANELPQELSQLSEQYAVPDVHFQKKKSRKAAMNSDRHEKAGGPEKAASVTKNRRHTVTATTVFVEDGHPTILAAARGLVRPS